MGALSFIPANTKDGAEMSAKRSDKMLGELMAVIADYLDASEDDTDLRGRVRAWLAVATGEVHESDTGGHLAGLSPIDRRVVLVQLLKERGEITTTELAVRSHCCPETARLWLRKLAARRVVRAIGDKKGRVYIPGVHFGDFDKSLSDTSDTSDTGGNGHPKGLAGGGRMATGSLSEVHHDER